MDSAPQITLEKESHVFNLNELLGPVAGARRFSTGVEAELTSQHGFGGSNAFLNPAYTNGLSFAPATVDVVPTILSSDYQQSTVTESAALRYSKIPWTTLFLEAKLQQQSIGENEQDLQKASGFAQKTALESQLSDLRAGFHTSPWRSVSFSADVRRYLNDTHYNNDPDLPLVTGYPGFIRARDLRTDEVETKLSWHPYSWLRTAFSYQYETTRSWVDTPIPSAAAFRPEAAWSAANTIRRFIPANATMTPCPRLFLSTNFFLPAIQIGERGQ